MNDGFIKKMVFGEAINSFFIVLTKPIILVTSILIAKYLSLYEYGSYKLILSFYSLVSGFSVNFLDNLILNEMNIFHGNHEEYKAKKIFNEYFFVKFSVGLLLFILVFLFSEIIGKYYSDDISNWVRIISLLFLIENIKNVILLFFQYKLKFFLSSFYIFALELFKLVFVLVMYYFFTFGISEVIYTILLSNLLIIILSLPTLIKNYIDDRKKDRNDIVVKKFLLLETMVHYGKWVILRSYFISFVQNIRPWIIKFFLGTESVAIFSIASDFVENIKSIISFNSLKVFISRKLNDKGNLRKIYTMGSKYITYFYVLMVALGLIAVPILIKTFIPKYTDSLPYFYIIIFSTIFFGISTVSSKIIYALRKQKELIIIPFSNALFIIIFNFCFTPFLGLYGTSIELLLNQILVCLISYLLVIKYKPELKLSIKNFLLNQEDKDIFNKLKRLLKEKIGFVFSQK